MIMASFSWKNFTLVCLHLLFFSICLCSKANAQNPYQDVCAFVYCGQGQCKASTASLYGFYCECFPGWKKIQIGPLTFPPCVVPYCQDPAAEPAPGKEAKPCADVWCGDGTCVKKGCGYACLCEHGSHNLFNSSALPCFKPCSMRVNCYEMRNGTLMTPAPAPTPLLSSPGKLPVSSKPSTADHGLAKISKCSRTLRSAAMIVLVAIFFKWL